MGRARAPCDQRVAFARQGSSKVAFRAEGRTSLFRTAVCGAPLAREAPWAQHFPAWIQVRSGTETESTFSRLFRSVVLDLLSVGQPCYILISGLNQELATEWFYTWFTGRNLGSFCTICRAWPVKRGPVANFGQRPGQRSKKLNLK